MSSAWWNPKIGSGRIETTSSSCTIPLRQEVVEDEARTPDRLRDQDFLLFGGVDSEFVGLVLQQNFLPPSKGVYPKGRLAIHLPLSLRLEVGVFSPNFDKTVDRHPSDPLVARDVAETVRLALVLQIPGPVD